MPVYAGSGLRPVDRDRRSIRGSLTEGKGELGAWIQISSGSWTRMSPASDT